MDRGSERKVPHIGTETRCSEEYWSMAVRLNQPSSVKDDGPTGCKLLLCGINVRYVYLIAGTA